MIKRNIFILILFNLVCFDSAANGETLHVAVADSMCAVMRVTGEAFSKQTEIPVKLTCKSSGMLFEGIRAGVIKADYYISANRSWMDKAVKADLIEQAKIKSPWGNKLVVAVLKQSPLVIHSLDDLSSDTVKKVIIGDPGKAPFGRYAKEALIKAGLWPKVREKTVSRKKISLAIEMLEGDDVSTVALLYASNLTANLRAVFVIPETNHESIRYFVAPLKTSKKKAELNEFIAFLEKKETAQQIIDSGIQVFDNDSVH
ncbi:MAG: molybdate ABC transporter substrate-binding protein [Desulfobulbaceae bacterium]|nr:molybdate ABC transporter substrate-binding protein [Desulfobulbaceae bacterium]